jgi:hypothetical protein
MEPQIRAVHHEAETADKEYSKRQHNKDSGLAALVCAPFALA